jgi:hypothetical protein
MFSKKGCAECGMKTDDTLVIDKNKRKESVPYCRTHLLKHFEIQFLSFPHKMVVYYPCLEGLRGTYVYVYDTLAELEKQRGIDKRMKTRQIEILNKSLGNIAGSCSQCSSPARVAYFDPHFIRWEKDWPLINLDLDDPPKLLCQRCTFREIGPSLSSFQDNYSNGLFAPCGGEGYFSPTCV